MDESREPAPAVERYAESLEVALEERKAGEGDPVAAIDREVAAEAEQIRDYLDALDRLDHALTVHAAIGKATKHTDSSMRYPWQRDEYERAHQAQLRARRGVAQLLEAAEHHIERIKVLRRIRELLLT